MMGRIRMTARSNPHDYTIKWAGRGLDSFGVIANDPERVAQPFQGPRHYRTTLPGPFPGSTRHARPLYQ